MDFKWGQTRVGCIPDIRLYHLNKLKYSTWLLMISVFLDLRNPVINLCKVDLG
jgi:hypothetical protein